ncbi:hypothetical protein V6N13_106156 [Hibiscus sabdariffa]|uniref:Uncharacterized protein n=1 Tax=Hibiscus sabdariffa TaxID=183260 RepID=A0ABR2EZT9_9ROSI
MFGISRGRFKDFETLHEKGGNGGASAVDSKTKELKAKVKCNRGVKRGGTIKNKATFVSKMMLDINMAYANQTPKMKTQTKWSLFSGAMRKIICMIHTPHQIAQSCNGTKLASKHQNHNG